MANLIGTVPASQPKIHFNVSSFSAGGGGGSTRPDSGQLWPRGV
jgi:hypothetical protein